MRSMSRFRALPYNEPLPRAGAYLVRHDVTGRCYVGVSHNVAKRLIGHANGQGPRKFKNAVRKYGPDAFTCIPLYYSLTTDTSHLPQIETVLIAEYRCLGTRGFNVKAADGGVGPYGPEFGALIAAHHSVPENLAKMTTAARERAKCPVICAKLSESAKAGWQDPGVRERMQTGLRTALAAPEVKARLWTPERRAKIGTIGRRTAADPVVRAKMLASFKTSAQTPERREQYSLAAKEAWADPAKKARLVAGHKRRWADLTARGAMSKAMKARNLRWITNGQATRRMCGADPIPDGWRYGRAGTATKGTVWITDGTTNRRVPAGSAAPDGWSFGNTSKGKPKPRSHKV
jgi:hypothetical protein